jgi:hypothetical protein
VKRAVYIGHGNGRLVVSLSVSWPVGEAGSELGLLQLLRQAASGKKTAIGQALELLGQEILECPAVWEWDWQEFPHR